MLEKHGVPRINPMSRKGNREMELGARPNWPPTLREHVLAQREAGASLPPISPFRRVPLSVDERAASLFGRTQSGGRLYKDHDGSGSPYCDGNRCRTVRTHLP